MAHPRVRTWTLGTLDRAQAYRLWFDPEARRWEVRPEGQDSGTLTTRPSAADGGGALRTQGAPAPRTGGAPGRRDGRGAGEP